MVLLRSLALRFLGLCVAAMVLAAAVQLLTLSFDLDPVLDRDGVADVTGWLRRRPSGGAGVLIGLALLAAGCWLVWTLVASLRTSGEVLTTRRRDGWTRIDRHSLARSLERRLALVNPDGTVSVRVRRNRQVDVTVATTSTRPGERLEEIRAELETLIADRGLPCRPGRFAAETSRRRQRSRVG